MKYKQIAHDTNGNPRYVFHFTNFLSRVEKLEIPVTEQYEYALRKAKEIGGKKFHNKQFGGGIVLQSYNLRETKNQILELAYELIQYHRQPTKGEIKFGEGAIHYKSFDRDFVSRPDGTLKDWVKCPVDGLRYYY